MSIDIMEKLRNNDYNVNINLSVTHQMYCENCDNVYHVRSKDIPEYCSNCGNKIGDTIRRLIEENKAVREAYRKKEAEMYNQFKKDALDYVGLTDHPKADKIYAYAWDHGHSSGFSEVLNTLVDLYDTIFKD